MSDVWLLLAAIKIRQANKPNALRKINAVVNLCPIICSFDGLADKLVLCSHVYLLVSALEKEVTNEKYYSCCCDYLFCGWHRYVAVLRKQGGKCRGQAASRRGQDELHGKMQEVSLGAVQCFWVKSGQQRMSA